MKNLELIGRQCIEDLEAIGYSIPNITWNVNGRLSKTWGYCRTKRRNGKTYAVSIDIAKFLLDESIDEKVLRNTIYHEIAHAIDDNKHGHGTEWIKIADIINDCYNMNITQYVQKEEIISVKSTELYRAKYKTYIYMCQKCGKEIKVNRARKPKYWGHNLCYHKVCDGRLIDWKVE